MNDPSLSDLLAVIQQQEANLPPLAQWQPAQRQSLDVFIDREGHWFHEGTAFQRPALVKLLASVLHHDDDGYALLTPDLRWDIRVADVPFVAYLDSVQGEGGEQNIFLRTTIDDLFRLDAEHPLQWREQHDGQLVPYALVRDNLWARVSRSAYYQLTDYLQEQEGQWGWCSAGVFMTVLFVV